MSGTSYITLTLAPGQDMLAAIASAISHLPAQGGCIDARGISGQQVQSQPATVVVNKPVTLLLGPVHIQAIANPVFQIVPPAEYQTTSFTVIGLDPVATVIEAYAPGVTLFALLGDFMSDLDNLDGQPTVAIKHCQLYGGNRPGVSQPRAGTGMLSVPGLPATNFQDGLLLIEDNLISGFGATAILGGPSAYFFRIHRNQILNNHQAIYLDNNTEASITENYFAQGLDGDPTLTLIGPMHRVVNNYFTRHILFDKSVAPDILLQTELGWQDQAGGFVWILDNRFMGERENFDSRRSRIRLQNPPGQQFVAGPAIVRGNQFLGPAATGSVTASGGVATFAFTFTATEAFFAQGLVPGQKVTIYDPASSGTVPPVCGTFPIVSVINTIGSIAPQAPQGFTYNLPSGTTITTAYGPLAVVPADAAAIELDADHLPWDVQGNFFSNYAILVNDNQSPLASQSQQTPTRGYGWGQSIFADNRVAGQPSGFEVFKNGGNNFTWIRPPGISREQPLDPWPGRNETLSLRNRLPQSEKLGAWGANNGLQVLPLPQGTPTPDQLDPFGTTRAWLLSCSGTLTNQSIESGLIDLSGLSGPGSVRLVITFWAKQGPASSSGGPLSSLGVGLFDLSGNPPDFFGNFFSVSLGATWKRYKLVTNQLRSVTDQFVLLFYPGDPTFTSGSICLFGPQVSDEDSDYYPTTAGALVDPLAGQRFERTVLLTSMKAATHTGDSSSAPKVSASSLGTGGSVDATGCTDMAGVIVIQAGTNAPGSGTVTLTYHQPYSGSSSPVVVASLQDGTHLWASGAQVRVTNASNTSCTLTWTNNPSLAAGSYAISYMVVGRG